MSWPTTAFPKGRYFRRLGAQLPPNSLLLTVTSRWQFRYNSISFRIRHLELEAAQLDLNISSQWQFQKRFILNWGRIISRKQGASIVRDRHLSQQRLHRSGWIA
jgi:hypothetical protein